MREGFFLKDKRKLMQKALLKFPLNKGVIFFYLQKYPEEI